MGPKPDSAALQALWSQGRALHQQGRIAEAREAYGAVLAQDPDHFDALHLMGVTCIQTGQLEQGADLIGRAVAIKPDEPAAHSNLANALNGLGRHAEAIAACDRAIALDPAHAEAHGNRGQALYLLDRPAEALDSYSRLCALRPDRAPAHYNRGVMLRALGRLEEALAACDRALALNPDYPEALLTRGITLRDLGRLDDAISHIDKAVTLRPDHAEGWYELGVTLRGARRLEEAMACYYQAILRRPDYAEAWNNRGNALLDQKRWQEALDSYDQAVALLPGYAGAHANRMIPLIHLRRPEEALAACDTAIALQPDYAEAWNNRANALYELRRLDEVLQTFDTALAIRPDYAEALSNRGVVFHELRRFDEALADFDRAIALKPEYPEAQYGQAMTRLTLGDYARAWPQYEWRWGTAQFAEAVRDLGAPLWLGQEPLAGRTILLHGEQGLGDTLQFCRYAPRVAAMGATVILEVQAGLERLLARLPGVRHIVTRGLPLPDYDLQTPLMSLPLALGLAPDQANEPYLTPDPGDGAAWAERLAPDKGLKVGLCWAGGARPDQPIAHAIDKRRSLPLTALKPLADIPGVRFYSLQKGGAAAEQLAPVVEGGWAIGDYTADWRDFADTAAFVANLDLVIACDTSTAHLAGGLGKPTWILDRFDACWRWLDGREDSPWYPSARLFRQAAPGDWAGVVARVKEALSTRASMLASGK